MSTSFTDRDLERRIAHQQAKIRAWIRRRHLGEDYSFRSWIEHYDDEPTPNFFPVLLCCDGHLCSVLNGYSGSEELREEFANLFEGTDFYFDFIDHTTIGFWYEEPDLQAAYFNYFRWRWVCDLIKPNFVELYEEIYEEFLRDPGALHRIEPRKFEMLLDGIFRNNGFATKLGPGHADEGVDLRLYSTDAVSETVTLVQAKRYSSSRPIGLEAVQALIGAVEVEGASRGLFITTSRYLPGAMRFAARRGRRITLATSEDILKWSEDAVRQITQERARLLSPEYVSALISRATDEGMEGRIVHARAGYGIVDNDFCVVLKETAGAALLMRVPKKVVSHDGYGQRGLEVPDLETVRTCSRSDQAVFRAKKAGKNLWGQRKLYSLWGGEPELFDSCD